MDLMLEKHECIQKFTPFPSLPLMREVDSSLGEDGGRESYPSVTLGKRDSSPNKGSLGRCQRQCDKLQYIKSFSRYLARMPAEFLLNPHT